MIVIAFGHILKRLLAFVNPYIYIPFVKNNK